MSGCGLISYPSKYFCIPVSTEHSLKLIKNFSDIALLNSVESMKFFTSEMIESLGSNNLSVIPKPSHAV